MRLRRRFVSVLWLALILTAAAPVLAYGHLERGPHGEILESCAIAAHDDSHEHPGHTHHQHDHSGSQKGVTPHCPYCPGFSAAAALSPGVPHLPAASRHEIPPEVVAFTALHGRSSLRVAQPRAPPPAI
jgi:hypothetical protein